MKMTLLVSAIFSIASWAVGLSPGHTTQQPGCGLQVLPCPPKLSRVSCMELKTGGQSVGTARRIKEMAKILIAERLLGSIVGAPYIFRPSVKFYKTPLSGPLPPASLRWFALFPPCSLALLWEKVYVKEKEFRVRKACVWISPLWLTQITNLGGPPCPTENKFRSSHPKLVVRLSFFIFREVTCDSPWLASTLDLIK